MSVYHCFSSPDRRPPSFHNRTHRHFHAHSVRSFHYTLDVFLSFNLNVSQLLSIYSLDTILLTQYKAVIF